MKAVTTAQMRELDSRTISESGIPGELLMERAGRGVADAVGGLAELAKMWMPSVLVVAGRGNNGGDAFVAARILAEKSFDVEVLLAGRSGDVRGDARIHLEAMQQAGVVVRELPAESDWSDGPEDLPKCDMVVDGVLGTGISGPAKGVAARAVSFINALSKRSLVVAIDVPSGLNADTGSAEGEAVTADLTVTMGLPKIGFARPGGIEHCGCLQVVDIGIPPEFVLQVVSGLEIATVQDFRSRFGRRPRASHKGSFGHVLIIGGSAGYSGAVTMAAKAALRSGAGLVSVFTPRSMASAVACAVQEAMVHGMKETAAGSLSADLWSEAGGDIGRFDAILIGPGMSANNDTRAVVMDAVRRSKVPLVLDADAINVLKCDEHLLEKAGCPIVLTPHPGELGRFLGRDIAAIQSDRVKAAVDTAGTTNATVVLKGAGTVVSGNGHLPSVNMTGNPGMASGGTGDVLAGLLAGLVAQGMAPFDAARAAVYLHGRAGDRAAWRLSQAGLVAGDVIDELPLVLREVSGR